MARFPGVRNWPRVQFFFRDAKYTWSEVHYRIEADEDEDATFEAAEQLGLARVGCLGVVPFVVGDEDLSPSLDQIRITWLRERGSSAVSTVFRGKTWEISELESNMPPDRPYSTLRLRAECTDRYRKSIYMRGIPDSVITDPQGPTFAESFLTAFSKFETELAPKKGWGTLVRNTDVLDFPEVKITEIGLALSGNVEVFAPNHGLVDGDTAVIRSGLFEPATYPLRGHWPIKKLTDNTYEVLGASTVTGYIGGAISQKLSYTVEEYTRVFPIAMTSHRTGIRGVTTPRGRNRKRNRNLL